MLDFLLVRFSRVLNGRETGMGRDFVVMKGTVISWKGERESIRKIGLFKICSGNYIGVLYYPKRS